MSVRARVWCAVAAALLVVWALFLFMSSPKVVIDGADRFEITCKSVLNAGYFETRSGLSSVTYQVTSGEVPDSLNSAGSDDPVTGAVERQAVESTLESKCANRRTTYAAGMALVLTPAAVLAALALGSRRLPDVIRFTRAVEPKSVEPKSVEK